MELWGWLVGISSTRRYCTSKIVVKPKKNLSQKLDQTKKRSVFRLTGSIWFYCHCVLLMKSPMFGPKPLDIFGPWAQDGPSHLAASSARCRKCWFTSLRRMVSQRPSEPPTNSTVNCSVPSGNFLGLTGQGTPRNPKEPWPPKKTIRLQADLVGFGWVSWVSVTGMYKIVQNVWGLMELCRASFR